MIKIIKSFSYRNKRPRVTLKADNMMRIGGLLTDNNGNFWRRYKFQEIFTVISLVFSL